MKSPPPRKKTEKQCPINVDGLHRRWERGDRRIDWPRISHLLKLWYNGEKVPWRALSHTFIKKGPRPPVWRPNVVDRPRRQDRAARNARPNPNIQTNDFDYLDRLIAHLEQRTR